MMKDLRPLAWPSICVCVALLLAATWLPGGRSPAGPERSGPAAVSIPADTPAQLEEPRRLPRIRATPLGRPIALTAFLSEAEVRPEHVAPRARFTSHGSLVQPTMSTLRIRVGLQE